MEDEAEVIKQRMEQTRTSLSEKLEALEQKVVSTVEQTTGAVVETVETVKEAVEGTVGAVKSTVEETVETVKETFDLRRQVEAHPWPMFGGSIAVGFLLGQIVPPLTPVVKRYRVTTAGNGKHKPRFTYPETSAEAAAAPPGTTAKGMSLLNSLGEVLAPAMGTVKSVAIGAATGVLGEMIANAVPPEFRGQVHEVIEEINTKLGGRHLFPHDESGATPSNATAGDGGHRWS
jgi:ElaB/YqjD/DUF883 family membrane-anchored ribosome-binding protein